MKVLLTGCSGCEPHSTHRALADYRFAAAGIPAAAVAILLAVPPSNPRPVTEANLEALLRAALTGADPATLA